MNQTHETFGTLPQWQDVPELFVELTSPRKPKAQRQLEAAEEQAAIESTDSFDAVQHHEE